MSKKDISIKEEKKDEDDEREVKKWMFYYLSHGKAISEYSPELNILLRQYSIKKLYDLGQSNPKVKDKVFEFLHSIMYDTKAEKISKDFNVDAFCQYEDFINFIEKVFESVEGEYKGKILNYDFSNYLEIIALYRLIVDITDLVDLWKEKDENILKFQTFCKYRVIKIHNMKINEKNRKKTDVEKEVDQLAEDIKKEEIEKKKQMEEMKKKQIEEMKKKPKVFNVGNNNNKIQAPQQGGNSLVRNRTMISSVIVPNSLCDINVKNPYEDSYSSMRKSSFDKEQNQMNIYDFSPNVNQIKPVQKIQTTSQIFQGAQFKQYPLYNQNNPMNKAPPVNIAVPNPYGDLSLDFKQVPQKPPANLNQSENKKSIVPKRREKPPIQKDPDIDELDKILLELTKKPSNETKKEEKPSVVKKEEKKKEEIPIVIPKKEKKPFEQLHTDLLPNYVYPGNKDVKMEFPIKIQSIQYVTLKQYIKTKLLPKITEDIKNKKPKEALKKSEMVLYYLTNIVPKESKK